MADAQRAAVEQANEAWEVARGGESVVDVAQAHRSSP